ncbi:hypothetical protein BCV69DRAFT_283534 [Microstroma glucosiphilum]|uniref:Chitinase domain-containing protein 1 n=1 Tax=Pseudomicrostroma glucosiphilum TaxID=1684307 RepID=A0A316U6C2_9BASI|nr:hypothetical protein BCV69DRAFT_283534 [Pseudomicrostroma glucosiphilum]PWN20011.1 hypothetical protein BCV69DRAFT_283534 [Pseudomicrostroma glucosiphilum]
MAYVTPWNQEGYTLAEAYRGRLYSVSPVWYTITPSGDDVTKYSVLGGPPRSSDAEWYLRLSQPAVDKGTGRTLPPVKILPRFRFEGWQAQDYKTLLSAAIEGIALTENIMMEVMTRKYDGVVIETGAMWALREPIKVLADRLHGEGKQIVVVMPALRNEAITSETDALIKSGVKDLAPFVDKIQIMTYDYTGSQGTYFDPSTMTLPADSILRTDGIRLPGPNTPFSYLRNNMEAFLGSSKAQAAFSDPLGQFGVFDDLGEAAYNDTDRVPADKLMMGVAMYGYTYPLAHVLASGNTQAVSPPTSPTAAKDNSTEEQEKYRLRADQREAVHALDAARILAAVGDPVTIREIREVFTAGKALVRKDASSGEAYFDYLKLKEDGSVHTREDGSTAPVAWYRRAYWPTPTTIKERIEVVEEHGVKSVALWDIGQGGAWLLHSL